jgi:hypothetical protein
MGNTSEAAAALLKSAGAQEVNDSGDILGFLRNAGGNRNLLEERGRLCRDAVLSLTGATRRTVGLLMSEAE